LVKQLADLFPDSVHVESAGLDHAGDEAVWEYARLSGLAIVTKDEDYDYRA
jgi:predicted nuclease of predicted toxin-antitoxin system